MYTSTSDILKGRSYSHVTSIGTIYTPTDLTPRLPTDCTDYLECSHYNMHNSHYSPSVKGVCTTYVE